METKVLKKRAREALKQNRKVALFPVFIILVLATSVGIPEFLMGTIAEFAWPFVYFVLLVGPILAGINWLFLDIYDEEEDIRYSTTFNPIRNYKKVALLTGIVNVLTVIGLAAFLIPGLVVGLLLSQAVYLLKENPDSSVGECLKGSFSRMKGHVLELLVLVLSFAIYLVPTLIAWTVPFFGVVNPYVGGYLIVGGLVYLMFAGFYLVPLFGLSMAAFYREVISRQKLSK